MQRKYSYPELVEFYNSLAMEPSSSRPLSRTSKRSPATSPSPTRRALQQRSDSQINVTSAPTIRIVAESGPEVYSKSPFPTLPSQILSPSYVHGPEYLDQDARVSDDTQPTNAYAKEASEEPLVPRPLQPRKSVRHSTSTTTSEAETITASSLVTPSSSHFSQSTSPPSTPPDDSELPEHKLPALPEESTPELDVSRSTIRKVIPSSPNEEQPLTTTRSETSIPTSASSDTVTSSKKEASSPNYYVFQPPPEDESSGPTLKRKRDFSNLKKPLPKPYESVESIAFSDASYSSVSERPRSASNPATASNAVIRAAIESGVKIQYPVVQPPSASGSWAESSSRPQPTKTSPSMNDSFVRSPQWTSRLSTIPSESERNSQSVDGSGRRSGSQNYGGNGGRRRTISSMISSEGSGVWTGSSETGSIPMPPPLFINNRALPPPPPPGRDSEEGDDTLGELHSPPLRQQRSGFLQRIRSRPTSSDSVNSQLSFAGDLSWARSYYRHGDQRSPYNFASSSESRLNTGTDGNSDSPTSEAFPPHIYRPRNRPLNDNGRRESTIDSMIIEEGTPRHSRVRGGILRPVQSIQDSLREMWSPHLHRDRRSNMVHYGAWRAPSFDEPFWSRFYGPVNRQIWLFCIGFVFPPGKFNSCAISTLPQLTIETAWILGAILPLPRKPPSVDGPASRTAIEESMGRVYLQNTSVVNVAEIDERRYQKARWWRILNRIMIAPAFLVMGAVVSTLTKLYGVVHSAQQRTDCSRDHSNQTEVIYLEDFTTCLHFRARIIQHQIHAQRSSRLKNATTDALPKS